MKHVLVTITTQGKKIVDQLRSQISKMASLDGLERSMDWVQQLTSKRSITDRAGGWTITAFLLLSIYLLSAWSDVSTDKYATRIITFSNTVAPAPPSPSSPAVEIASTPPPVVTLPKRATIKIENLDLARKRPTLSKTRVDPNTAPSRTLLSPERQPTLLESRSSIPETSGIRRRIPRGLTSQALLPSSRPSIEAPSTNSLDIVVPETDAPEIREPMDVPEVRVFDESTLSTESEQTKEIVQWVIKNHIDIPTVVQSHMDFEDGDKTTGVTVRVDGREVQIYLMARLGYDQLHILLVDDSRSYLYVNRGVRDQASRFRVGQVTRHGDLLARIVSQEREISSDEAQTFYSIFTDWWVTAQ